MSNTHDLGSLRLHENARPSRKTGKRTGIIISVAVVVLLIAAVGALAAFKTQKPIVEVTSAKPPSTSSAGTLLNASGYVTPRRRATIAAKVTGRVEEMYADEGMHVKLGQVLATLDCSQPKAALVSAQADRDAAAAAQKDYEVQLINADYELRRVTALKDAGVDTQSQLDNARMASGSLQAKINLAKQQARAAEARIGISEQDIENCVIRAPFDGIVVSKDAQRGEMVSPVSAGGGFTRTGIATVVDMNSNEIEVDVNESYIARVVPGQKVVATLDAYPDSQLPAKVRTVIPTADREKATVKVRATFDHLDSRILPDMGVKLAFLEDASRQPKGQPGKIKSLIPQDAVQKDESGNPTVFVVTDGKLERRSVNLGLEHGEDVEVIAGVVPGEMLVVKGAVSLHEGQAVQIKQQ
jgi:RND family efflux transporter MFP subunit